MPFWHLKLGRDKVCAHGFHRAGGCHALECIEKQEARRFRDPIEYPAYPGLELRRQVHLRETVLCLDSGLGTEMTSNEA
jgi:hypothetical protein